ncbi:MAG: transketolase family protein [Bdellovibrionales bacterium]
MRNKFADVFFEEAQKNGNLVLVVADISPAGSIAKFRQAYPHRFINTGVAEQIMIGMAAGLAQEGMRPVAYTIATFTLYRPFEFIRDDICYQNLPVTMVGIGGGVNYSTLGATHHAQEDISVATSVPNLSVIAPIDPLEAEAATRWCLNDSQGPVYLRLGKAGEPVLTAQAEEPWVYGKIRRIRKGAGTAFLTYGGIAKTAIQLAAGEKYRHASVYSVSTVKPLDIGRLHYILGHYDDIIVIEEASGSGLLGHKVKQTAFENGTKASIRHFHLKDEFIHIYGSHDDILGAHGLSLDKIKSTLAA